MGNDRKITNTATLDPMLLMMDVLGDGSGRGIEAQEARGQAELAACAQLPSKGSENPAWAKMGVAFGPVDPSDPLFRPATLPEGWKIARTDHSMWSNLVDDKGRKRASIFYKAAFYDRDASVNLVRRFNIRTVYENKTALQMEVIDGQARVFATAEVPMPGRDDWKARDEIEKRHQEECSAWLAARYPNWEDASAHWD